MSDGKRRVEEERTGLECFLCDIMEVERGRVSSEPPRTNLL